MVVTDSADRRRVAKGRLHLSVLLIALLAPAAAECQSDAALWRFVYPNAKALISINWQRIRQSPAGAMIRDQWLNAGPIAALPGIELLDDIDRVVISSPGNEAIKDTGTGTAVVPAQAPMLIAVGGHFDAVRVRQLFTRLGGKAQAYNSYQVYRPQGQDAKDMAYVLFDAGTILFGDAPSLFAALDRNQFAPPAAEPGSIVARGAELDRAYELSLVITTPDIMSSDRLAGLFHADDWAPDAQGFEAGVNLRSGLAADVTVRFGSEAAAKRVVAEMTRLTAIAAKDKAEPQMRDIARKLKFNSDGPAAKISLRLTPQDLEKSARAFAAAHQAPVALAASAGPVPSPGSSPPAPAKPAVIRIEGLDDGPREIPYPDQQH
jgi:hypothetical protein